MNKLNIESLNKEYKNKTAEETVRFILNALGKEKVILASELIFMSISVRT